MRSATRAVVSLIFVVAIAGCLAACSPTVSPHVSARQRCTPTTAHVAFGTPVQGKKAPVEAHLISFENGVTVTTPVPTEADTSAFISFSADGELSDISSKPDGAWQTALLSRLRRTKSVPSGFGDGTEVAPSDASPDATTGKYGVVTEEELTTVPLTIRCAGESTLTGSIAAYADTGSFTYLFECGTTPDGTPAEAIATMGAACTKE